MLLLPVMLLHNIGKPERCHQHKQPSHEFSVLYITTFSGVSLSLFAHLLFFRIKSKTASSERKIFFVEIRWCLSHPLTLQLPFANAILQNVHEIRRWIIVNTPNLQLLYMGTLTVCIFPLYSNKIYLTRWRQNSPKDLKTKASESDKRTCSGVHRLVKLFRAPAAAEVALCPYYYFQKKNVYTRFSTGSVVGGFLNRLIWGCNGSAKKGFFVRASIEEVWKPVSMQRKWEVCHKETFRCLK